MDKAVLVGINLHEYIDINYQLDELENLANSCNIEVTYKIIQDILPTPNFYVGRGKLDEIKMAAVDSNSSIVIFNDELTPAQLKNLENALELKVIDRSLLILNIFSSRANTHESALEVELAQLKYMLPRLVGLSSSLSRQGSGFNAKGPGEKKIELDRRLIQNNIVKIRKKLDEINKSKENMKNKRKNTGIPSVCLVGYTNAGKSSLMNRLVEEFGFIKSKTVYAEDQLFATLSTSVRHIILNDNTNFILSDTIGFISKLPHHLIESFKTTLSEVMSADLILHVVDVSNKYYDEQIIVTNNVLKSLNVTAPMIYVFNKCDLLDEQFFPEYDNSIIVSVKSNQNIYLLINKIKEYILNDYKIAVLHIPYNDYKMVNSLYTDEHIINIKELDEYVLVEAKIKNKNLHLYEKFIINN